MKEQLSGPFPVKLNGGMIGCLLSHVSIYKDAYERGFNTVWICEDDIKFTDDVKKLSGFVDELNSIDPDWDILYTDYTQHGTGMQAHRPGQSPYRVLSQIVNQSKTLVRMHGRHQTHSMIFSKKGIKKVLDYFTHIHLWTPIDIDIHYVPNIREYSVRKDIATFINDSPYSDTEHKNN
jgi:GR25 family glycosyltransferase involved in LPS biosynthesis